MTLIDVRDAVADDVPELAGLFRRASLSNHGDRALLLARPELLLLPEDLLTQREVVVAVQSDGERLGFASTRAADDGVVELEDLFVEPHWMRRGVGRALVKELVDRAARSGASRLEVTGNEHALAFYRALGFEEAGQAQTALRPAPRLRLSLAQAASR